MKPGRDTPCRVPYGSQHGSALPGDFDTVQAGPAFHWLDKLGRSGQIAIMKNMLLSVTALLALAVPAAVSAELPVGTKAPEFHTSVALAGKTMRFDLATALRRGPVVLYFYPKAFTQGCTLEAHAFAEASQDFGAYGATVIGLSADDLPTLKRFSTEACRDKFAVGVASPQIIKAYDVALKRTGTTPSMTDRTSYVIAQDGTITMVHSEMDYRDHVKLTLAAVKKLSAKP